MVELMLHHACQIALHPLIVVLEQLVVPCHMDARRAHHLLVDGRQRETAFLRGVGLAVIIVEDVGIDEHLTEALVLRLLIGEHVKVDHREANGLAYLGRSQPDAIGFGEGLPHVGYQLLQAGIVGSDVFGHLAQHRLAIYINR